MALTSPARFQHVPFDSDTQIFQPVAQYQGRVEDFDYVDEEWFATGEENGRPYTTWVRVRRPRDPNRFSGTIIVEPLHFYPITPIFSYTSLYTMRSGHAWVGVGSQMSCIDLCVKPSNPGRYDPLNIVVDELSPEAARMNLMVVPPYNDYEGLLWWETLNNVNRASRYILAQVGAAVKTSTGPFEGCGVKHAILSGHSYTGYVTTRYIREAHDVMRLEDGSPIYDGFFPSGWPSTPFEPLDVPIVQVITEGDIVTKNVLPYRMFYSGFDYRRPDSDESGDRFRLYEFSGFGHTSTQHPPINDVKFLEEMDKSLSIPAGAIASNLPFDEMYQTALDHLIRWVAEGVVPPRGARMEVASDGFFIKDEYGNTRGGVRCVQMDVPHAKYVGSITMDGILRMSGYGLEEPFDKEKLKKLYMNKDGYLEQFKNRLEELIKEGWFLKEDAYVALADAEKVDFN